MRERRKIERRRERNTDFDRQKHPRNRRKYRKDTEKVERKNNKKISLKKGMKEQTKPSS